MPSLTVLSPHQDDAGLSLATTIRSAARAGRQVRILNCFTVSLYAPHGSVRTAAEIGQLRREEDREFAARAGERIEILDIGMEDAPIRLGCPVSQVRRRRIGGREIEDATRIAAAVRPIAGELLLAPLGLGGHIDHLVAREAALQLAEAGCAVGFYEDLPYAAELRECCVVRAADGASARAGERLRAALVREEDAESRKRFAIEAYRSQLTEGEIDLVMGYGALRGGAERLWLTSGTQRLMPAPIELAGIEAGYPTAAMCRRMQCAAHGIARLARGARRRITQLSLRGGGVNAPQAN